jgi:hypothetical protein
MLNPKSNPEDSRSDTKKFYDELKGLAEDMEALRNDNERLKHEVLYWRIEAQTDHYRWLRTLEELERIRNEQKKFEPDMEAVINAGKVLSKEVMVAMLNGMAHEELIKAHADWKDAVDGKPNWGTTCKK